MRRPIADLVESCRELARAASGPDCFSFLARAARFDAPPGGGRWNGVGCGVGLTREDALSSAVGEALERRAAALYDGERVEHASFRDIRVPAVTPERFALFAPGQYDVLRRLHTEGKVPIRVPFTEATRTGWVRGVNLVTRQDVLVPAPFVYLPYRYAPDEPRFVGCSSSGLACHRDPRGAMLSALCEVVERDAISLVWLRAATLPRVDFSDSPVVSAACQRLSAPGAEHALFDATLDIGIPTIIAVFCAPRGGTVAASATHPVPDRAAEKALLEAAQVRISLSRALSDGPTREYAADFHDVVTFTDHARLYMAPAMRRHLDFLLASTTVVPLGRRPALTGGASDPLDTAVAAVGSAGFDVIACDLTSDALRRAGFHVFRVVIPGLHMLHARHLLPFLGGSRLHSVAERLSLRCGAAAGTENPAPHPFP